MRLVEAVDHNIAHRRQRERLLDLDPGDDDDVRDEAQHHAGFCPPQQRCPSHRDGGARTESDDWTTWAASRRAPLGSEVARPLNKGARVS